MAEERKIETAILAADDETRVPELTRVLEGAGFALRASVSPTTRVILLLPGRGGPGLTDRCLEIAERHPTIPAVVLHSAESESAHPAIDHHVFELLPATLEYSRVADHIRAVLARWHRFEELKSSAATLQRLESTTDLIYFDFRPDTGTFRPSPQLRQILGLSAPTATMPPASLLDRMHSDDRALFAGTLFEAARSGTPFCLPIRLTDTAGRQRHFRARGRAFGPSEKGHSAWVFGVCEDTTEHMEKLAEAEARSRVDELTGLGNRRYFDDCLAGALGRAKRERNQLGLIYVDLDRFKLINDTLGHDAGDQLLRVVAARLSDAVRAQDVVCIDQDRKASDVRVSRLGGDEFTVLLSGIHGPGDAELVAERMLAAIREPVEIHGQTLSPSASLGIAVFPDDGRTTDELRKRADAALYSAKAAGGGYRFFAKSMEDGKVRRLSLEHELRMALDRGEIAVLFQPRVDHRSGRTIGAEALLRWNSPSVGRVHAAELTQIAEETGYITTLGRWALVQACREAALWIGTEPEGLRLSVNLSPVQFQQDDVFTAVVETLKQTGFPPDRLDLEITETLLLRDDSQAFQSLEELRRIGVRIVLDGFGKGYSPLAVLMSQPIDVLKLDRRLVETVAPDGEGSQLLANVIRMAKDLSLHPVADGVSHADQAEFLAQHGCFEMQGYLFSGALSAQEFRARIGCA
ncbi:EAL domain-containing protein [Myxococcota bacterium]|nr:EAL domain-containing protein [Myxococcota bacterium]